MITSAVKPGNAYMRGIYADKNSQSSGNCLKRVLNTNLENRKFFPFIKFFAIPRDTRKSTRRSPVAIFRLGTLKIRNFCFPGGILPKTLWVTPSIDPRHVTKLEANRSPNKNLVQR